MFRIINVPMYVSQTQYLIRAAIVLSQAKAAEFLTRIAIVRLAG